MGGTRQMSSFRDLMKDEEPLFVMLARVALHDGETKQWYKTAEGHIAVTLKTHRHGAPIDAILPTLLGNSRGIYGIPEINTEVAVGFEGGDYEDDAFVLAVYGGVIPTQITEDGDARLVLVGDEIHAIAPNGTAVALLTFEDFRALIEDVLPAVGAGSATAVPATLSAYRSAHPLWPAGTKVLKGQ